MRAECHTEPFGGKPTDPLLNAEFTERQPVPTDPEVVVVVATEQLAPFDLQVAAAAGLELPSNAMTVLDRIAADRVPAYTGSGGRRRDIRHPSMPVMRGVPSGRRSGRTLPGVSASMSPVSTTRRSRREVPWSGVARFDRLRWEGRMDHDASGLSVGPVA